MCAGIRILPFIHVIMNYIDSLVDLDPEVREFLKGMEVQFYEVGLANNRPHRIHINFILKGRLYSLSTYINSGWEKYDLNCYGRFQWRGDSTNELLYILGQEMTKE